MIKGILPLTERKMKILLALYLWGNLHNNRISEITGIDKQNVSLHMKQFRKEHIVNVHLKLGKIVEFRFNRDVADILSSLLENYRKEALFLEYPVLERVFQYIIREVNSIRKLYVIGSYAQETAIKKSDIDLLIVSEKMTPSQAKKLSDEIFRLYNVKADIIVYTSASLKKEAKSNSRFYQTTFSHKKDHVLLFDKNGRAIKKWK